MMHRNQYATDDEYNDALYADAKYAENIVNKIDWLRIRPKYDHHCNILIVLIESDEETSPDELHSNYESLIHSSPNWFFGLYALHTLFGSPDTLNEKNSLEELNQKFKTFDKTNFDRYVLTTKENVKKFVNDFITKHTINKDHVDFFNNLLEKTPICDGNEFANIF